METKNNNFQREGLVLVFCLWLGRKALRGNRKNSIQAHPGTLYRCIYTDTFSSPLAVQFLYPHNNLHHLLTQQNHSLQNHTFCVLTQKNNNGFLQLLQQTSFVNLRNNLPVCFLNGQYSYKYNCTLLS